MNSRHGGVCSNSSASNNRFSTGSGPLGSQSQLFILCCKLGCPDLHNKESAAIGYVLLSHLPSSPCHSCSEPVLQTIICICSPLSHRNQYCVYWPFLTAPLSLCSNGPSYTGLSYDFACHTVWTSSAYNFRGAPCLYN